MTYHSLAAYSRLSRNPDGSLDSVQHQEAIQQAHAQANGNTVTAWFSDDDLSAWDEDVYRPGWEDYLAALQIPGKHDGASTYHFDRLARNGTDSERLLKVTKAMDLPLVTPQQVLDLGSNADARMVFRVLSAVQINQSDSTSRRVRDHKDVGRTQGRLRYVLGGTPPLGYQLGPEDKSDWVVDPDAATFLADLAGAVVKGEALTRAYGRWADRWARDGSQLLNARGEPVTIKQARAALQRPATYGLMTSRRARVIGRVRGRPAKVAARSWKAEDILGPTGKPSPLPAHLYWEVRSVFTANERGPLGDPDAYPLGPILRCGECGNQLTGELLYDRRRTGTGPDGRGVYQVVKVTPGYRCKNPHPKLTGPDGLPVTRACRGVSISAQALHEKVRDELETWAATSDWYAQAQGEHTVLTARQLELDTQAAQWRARAASLATVLDAGDAEYEQAMATIRGKLAGVKAEQEGLAAAAAEAKATPAQLDWDGMSSAEKRAMIVRAFGPTISVAKGNGGARALGVDDRVRLVPRLAAT